MKRLIVFLMALTAIGVQAEDFTYKFLVFTASDGTETALSISDLSITFDNGRLLAVNAVGSTTLQVSQLASMKFAEAAEVTGIRQTETGNATPEGPVDVYSLAGLHVGEFATMDELKGVLPDGIYIVKRNGTTTKITIKQ